MLKHCRAGAAPGARLAYAAALAGLLVAAAPAAAELLFSNPEIGGGGTPRWVAAGDLDSDGDLDLVAGNDAGTQIAVLLNRGDGLPASTTLRSSGASPRHVSLGDVDGDGDLDVIVSNQSGASLTLLHNDGAGSFDEAGGGASVIASGSQPAEVLFADFTGDMLPDIAVATAEGVRVHRNLGAGAFDAGVVSGGLAALSLAAADVDGDGDLDLLASLVGAQLLLNDGAGSFTDAGSLGGAVLDAAFGDVDGDGDPDLVVAERSLGRVGVLRNGGGVFSAPVYTLVGQPMSVVLIDLDDDGDRDLAVGNAFEDVIAVLRNDGSGAFGAPEQHRVPAQPFKVIAGDWNGDGFIDLAAVSQRCSGSSCFEGSIVLLLADAVGEFSSAIDYATRGEALGIAVGDLDGDHAPDLVAAVPTVSEVDVLLNAGDGRLVLAGAVPIAPLWPADVELADLDADGDPDLVAGAYRSGRVTVAENSGAGALTVTHDLAGAGPRIAAVEVADLDGDGDRDIVMVSTDPFGDLGSVDAYLNSGSGAFPGAATSAAVADRPNDLALGDIDGDLDCDAVSVHDGGVVQLLRNGGTGTFSAPVSLFVAGAPDLRGVALADLDGDTDLDLAIGAGGPDALVLLRNDGFGSFSAWSSIPMGSDPFEVLAEDLDADGDLDLAVVSIGSSFVAGEHSGNVAVLRNDGLGSFSEEGRFFVGLLDPSFGSPRAWHGDRIAAADFDRDGDLDLAVSHPDGEAVSILENRLVSPERSRGAVGPGGSLTSDDEADGADYPDPVETSVVSPAAGEINIVERAITGAVAGWRFFGQEVVVTAPPATPADPLLIGFRLDASRVPAGYRASSLRVFRNALLVPACVGTGPAADPDPCATLASLLGDGDVQFSVRSSAASVWNFGVTRPGRIDLRLQLSGPIGNEWLQFQLLPWQLELLLEGLADADDDGRDEMPGSADTSFAEVVAQSALLGEVKLRLRDAKFSPFEMTRFAIEETSGQVPGLLEMPPFTTFGFGQVTLLAWLEFEIPLWQALVHTQTPVRFEGIASAWPLPPGEVLAAIASVDLIDEQGQSSGFGILDAKFERTPLPPPPSLPPLVALPLLGPGAWSLLAGALGGVGARQLCMRRRRSLH